MSLFHGNWLFDNCIVVVIVASALASIAAVAVIVIYSHGMILNFNLKKITNNVFKTLPLSKRRRIQNTNKTMAKDNGK